MLDAFIIDQLRREREREQWEPIPLHLPLPPSSDPEYEDSQDGNSDGGVVIIDILNDDEQAARACDYNPHTTLNYQL